MKLNIVMHKGHDGANPLDSELDTLIRGVSMKHEKNGEWAEKYGTDYEDDKLRIHRYCWCEKKDCGYCNEEEPNFWYKPLNFKVSWYKYIGRSTDSNKKLTTDEFNKMKEDLL